MISEELKKELKVKLGDEKAKLEKELGKIAKPTGTPGDYETQFNELGTDREDNATEIEEYSDNLAVETSLEESLKDINEALERIESETYGICENCKEEIDIERLKAYPAAKACIKCK
ncbi:MAG: TraR/DksA C4-type zinc finger protein [Parcubacteria group bacterium]|jgi:DnaK suppressor protein